MRYEELSTVALPVVGPPRARRAPGSTAEGVALLALVTVVLHAAAGVLPDEPVVGVVTPLRLVVGVGVVALLVRGRPGPRWWRDPLAGAALGVLLVAALVTVVAGQEWSGWRGVLTQVAVFALAAGVARTWSAGAAPFGLMALVAVAVPAGVGVAQSLNRTPTGFCRGAANAMADVCGPDALVRAVGTLANPNLLAALLVLLLPAAVLAVSAQQDRESRLVTSAVVALGGIALVLTGSRSALVAAVVGSGVLVLALVHGERRTKRVAAVAAVLVVVVAGLVLAAGGSVGIRAEVWSAAVRSVAAHPLGVGLGRSGAVVSAGMPGQEAVQHAHNFWLDWAVAGGIPGLTAALALTVAAGVVAVRAVRAGSRTAVGAAAGLTGFAVMALVDHPANGLRIALAMWVVLGVLCGEGVRVRSNPEPRAAAAHGAVQVRRSGRHHQRV